MTFIQPDKNNSSFLNKILIILVIGLFFGAIWLIILYNNSVNLNHGVSDAKAELQIVQSRNSGLKDKLLTLLNKNSSGDLVSKNNLVEDKNPQYFPLNQQWSYASQY